MDDLLQKGVNSYKSGDHETARKLFISATKQNPDSERAWGWLYYVCKTDQERIYCLRKIVKINPHNLKAQEILTKLTLPEDPPLEQPLKHNTQNPVAISYQSQSQQITVNVPWYRSTVAYVLFFLFITPLWTLLIFTDKRQGKGIRALGLVIGAIYLYSFCILPILTNNNYL